MATAGALPLADESVHCVVTSPPYWALRQYEGIEGPQLGNERTPEEFIDNLILIFREIRRVVRPDGVCWVNLGDTYGGSGNQGVNGQRSDRRFTAPNYQRKTGGSLKSGDLAGIPWMFALAAREDGWFLRSDTIWAKPNPMPETLNGWRWERCRVKVSGGWKPGEHPRGSPAGKSRSQSFGTNSNAKPPVSSVVWAPCLGCGRCEKNGGLVLRRGRWRPTNGKEYLFLLTKSKIYFGNREAVAEPVSPKTHSRGRGVNPKAGDRHLSGRQNPSFSAAVRLPVDSRNPRDVWAISTEPSSLEHFATFPKALVRRALSSSAPEKVCGICGDPYAPFVDRQEPKAGVLLPTCACNAPPRSGLVMDPFAGSGTTGVVAKQMGLRFIGFDLSIQYAQMAKERLAEYDPAAVLRDGGRLAPINGPLFEVQKGFPGASGPNHQPSDNRKEILPM